MKTDAHLINDYWLLLRYFSPTLKSELAQKLSKTDDSDSADRFRGSFGAWKGEKNAEDIIRDLLSARNFNRKTELF